MSGPAPLGNIASSELSAAISRRLEAWTAERFAARIWERDPRLWAVEPPVEIADRMGWLELPERAVRLVPELQEFAEEVRSEGVRHVVLLGMGGSSLAPQLFGRVFGPAAGRPDLTVLDSTHPAQVAEVSRATPLDETLFIVSSKSGGTAETLSLFRHFWQRVGRADGAPGRRFVAITDRGTPLERLAGERHFRRVFPGPADVGGRYSALSVFGLVPAALLGVDLEPLIGSARSMAARCSGASAVESNPGLVLGAFLGEAGRAGRDKVTLRSPPGLRPFAMWSEQLIAESTGKSGRGLLPVVDDAQLMAGAYGSDRVMIELGLAGRWAEGAWPESGCPSTRIALSRATDLGAEFFRWEFAIAAAGSVLGIHPFNQPDVQRAKDLARAALAGTPGGPQPPPTLPPVAGPEIARWLDGLHAPQYVAIQAFIPAGPGGDLALGRLARVLSDATGCAVTTGYGPRYLHSTGQLHKGGPPTGRFVQLVDPARPDLSVPETDFTFGRLTHAEADGDAAALAAADRPVLRIALGADPTGTIGRLAEVFTAVQAGKG